jgi:hypothetical protein
MAKNKPMSTKEAVRKATKKARGTVSYRNTTTSGGGNLSPRESKARRQVERAEKAGAKTTFIKGPDFPVKFGKFASKTDVDASKKKTLKASGTGFKSTARQVKLERERTLSRVKGIAAREEAKAKKAKKK